MFKTVEWKNNTVVMIEQTLLPEKEVYRKYKTYTEVARAIKDMIVRGAPAIGVAAAMGVALGALKIKSTEMKGFNKDRQITRLMARPGLRP
jgi:methylthioribose-1-phosphate isomerase